jgi:hypothetical protein
MGVITLARLRIIRILDLDAAWTFRPFTDFYINSVIFSPDLYNERTKISDISSTHRNLSISSDIPIIYSYVVSGGHCIP